MAERVDPTGDEHSSIVSLSSEEVATKCKNILSRVCSKIGRDTARVRGVHAAVIKEFQGRFEIVSAAKGNNFMSDRRQLGNCRAIRDCHAEVLARRGLVLFLLGEMDRAKSGSDSCIVKRDRFSYALKPAVKFHLYINKLPCGGARLPYGCRNSESLRMRRSDGEGDVLLTVGGRLYKMSCSDKMALWNVVGVQGGLLSQSLEEPVFFSSVIVPEEGGSLTNLQTALFARLYSLRLHVNKPAIRFVSFSEGFVGSISGALVWALNGGSGAYIDTATGRRVQGDTDVSKCNIFRQWVRIVEPDSPGLYAEYKQGAQPYQKNKKTLREFLEDRCLGTWYDKPQDEADYFTVSG